MFFRLTGCSRNLFFFIPRSKWPKRQKLLGNQICFSCQKYFLVISRSIRCRRVPLFVMRNNSLLFGREEVAKIKWINMRFGLRWRQTGPAVRNKADAQKLSEAKDKSPDGMNAANCFACHNIDPAGLKWQREDWSCRSSVCVQQTSRPSLWPRPSEEPRYQRLNGIKHVGLHLFTEGARSGGVGEGLRQSKQLWFCVTRSCFAARHAVSAGVTRAESFYPTGRSNKVYWKLTTRVAAFQMGEIAMAKLWSSIFTWLPGTSLMQGSLNTN